jgi:hypothetical protein
MKQELLSTSVSIVPGGDSMSRKRRHFSDQPKADAVWWHRSKVGVFMPNERRGRNSVTFAFARIIPPKVTCWVASSATPTLGLSDLNSSVKGRPRQSLRDEQVPVATIVVELFPAQLREVEQRFRQACWGFDHWFSSTSIDVSAARDGAIAGGSLRLGA